MKNDVGVSVLDRYTRLQKNGLAYLAVDKVNLYDGELVGDAIIRFAQYESFDLEPAEIGLKLLKLAEYEGKIARSELIEVVRCKDCGKRNTPDCAMWYKCSICDGQWSWETDNGFCSIGERSVE